MDEPATFEARAVLAPRRARRAHLLLALPVVALVAVAGTGLTAHHDDRSTADARTAASAAADAAGPPVVAAMHPTGLSPSAAPESAFPTEVIGLGVQRLGAVLPLSLHADDVVVIAGWYVATSVGDCPRVTIAQPDRPLAAFEHVPDPEAYCDRSGVLFDSRPSDTGPFGSSGFPVITTSLVHGVEVPAALEVVGAEPQQVVVVGRLVLGVNGCERVDGCSRQLLVDHVAWTPAS
jgi:hypothetical protein